MWLEPLLANLLKYYHLKEEIGFNIALIPRQPNGSGACNWIEYILFEVMFFLTNSIRVGTRPRCSKYGAKYVQRMTWKNNDEYILKVHVGRLSLAPAGFGRYGWAPNEIQWDWFTIQLSRYLPGVLCSVENQLGLCNRLRRILSPRLWNRIKSYS